jgi:hypothetical protein
MRVFLHIGSHKTGTTAIQEFASNNSAWLRARGLLYPSFDLIGGTRERSHLGMVNRIAAAGPLRETEMPSRLLAEAARIARAEGLDVLLSAESLFRLGDDSARAVMAELRTAFGAGAVTVTASLRARADFAESLCRNRYRAFAKLPEPFADWMVAAGRTFEYERILQLYAAGLGGGQQLLAYSAATRDDFVALFFRRLGIDIAEVAQGVREKNPSLDAIDCLAKLIVMGGRCDDKMSRAFNNFALKTRIATDYGFLDRDREAEFTRRFAAENRRLVAAEPELVAVLGPDVAAMDRRPIDAEAQRLAEDRARAFRAAHKS